MEEDQFSEIQVLNDDEFNALISNPTDVSIFTANINNMNLLSPEQLEIINNL